MFSNPDIGEICDLLREVRIIAMVGLSPLQRRPSYRIARGLQGAGYKIVPVRPLVPTILGEKAYSSLSQVPDPIDLVHVFRPARFLDAIVDECLARNFKRLWASSTKRPPSARATAASWSSWTAVSGATVTDRANRCCQTRYDESMWRNRPDFSGGGTGPGAGRTARS